MSIQDPAGIDLLSRRLAELDQRPLVDVRTHVSPGRPPAPVFEVQVDFTDQSGGSARHFIYQREQGQTFIPDPLADLDPGDTSEVFEVPPGQLEIGVAAHDGDGNASEVVWDEVTV